MRQFRLLERQSTAAVVLGSHDWTRAGLRCAPSFLRTAKDLLHHLVDSSGMGLDPALVLNLFDDPTAASDQLVRLRDTFDTLLRERRKEGRAVADLLVYYIGHGQMDDHGHLSLLVRNSRKGMESETGIRAPDLARTLRVAAPQQRRVVILDCCFSEAAAAAFIGMAPTLDQAVGAVAFKDLRDAEPRLGTLLLCSSPVGEVSIGHPDADRTLFSGAMLDVLREGAQRYPEDLSFANLRDAIYERMLIGFGANAPRPVLHQTNAAYGDLTCAIVFPNRAFYNSGLPQVGQPLLDDYPVRERDREEREAESGKLAEREVPVREEAEREAQLVEPAERRSGAHEEVEPEVRVREHVDRDASTHKQLDHQAQAREQVERELNVREEAKRRARAQEQGRLQAQLREEFARVRTLAKRDVQARAQAKRRVQMRELTERETQFGDEEISKFLRSLD